MKNSTSGPLVDFSSHLVISALLFKSAGTRKLKEVMNTRSPYKSLKLWRTLVKLFQFAGIYLPMCLAYIYQWFILVLLITPLLSRFLKSISRKVLNPRLIDLWNL